MTRVFADAFFYVALLNRLDQHHGRVARYAREFDGRMVTTHWVLTEVANGLARVRLRAEVPSLLRDLEMDDQVKVIEYSPALYHRGLELYAGRPDKAWSLTDCISFVVMEDEGLSEALTGDKHFAQAGFVPVFGQG